MLTKKTKIVATIGPSSSSKAVFTELVKKGLDVARLNFSHGSQEEKLELFKMIRKVSDELEKPLSIMADLQGPKIRLGEIEGKREITKGENINLTMSPISDQELPMQFDLSPYVKKNQRIFLNDGLIELVVQQVSGKVVKTKALNSGWVSSHKGVNIPDTYIKGGAMTSKDLEDAEFALRNEADFIALSFVQTTDDLKRLKDLIKKYHSKSQIIVKIEKLEALRHLEEIIQETDAVMVARGDLAIESPASEVPIIQQKIIKLSRQFHKPVIIATQMLESMIENPRPTRAETSDVANAVLDQVDAVMLSAESASGKYPVETVTTMDQIIKSVEEHVDYKHYIKINWEVIPNAELSFSAITASAAALAFRIKAKAIVVATSTGRMARFLSSFRPESQIVAITHESQVKDQLSLVWGINPQFVDLTQNFDTFVEKMVEQTKQEGFVKKGDKIIVLTGSTTGVSGGTDTIRVITI